MTSSVLTNRNAFFWQRTSMCQSVSRRWSVLQQCYVAWEFSTTCWQLFWSAMFECYNVIDVINVLQSCHKNPVIGLWMLTVKLTAGALYKSTFYSLASSFGPCCEPIASVTGASNKLAEGLSDWLIEYAIFLHGLAQQRRSPQKRNLAQR